MRISGSQETGGRPLSTADLAAAARRPDSPVVESEEVESEEPVSNKERIRRQSADTSEAAAAAEAAAQRRPTAARGDVGSREAGGDVGSRGRWFNENGAPSPTGTSSATDRASADERPADAAARSDEALEPLFTPEMAETYRVRWTSIQSGFVDDPRRAVRSGDELVAQVMTNLANTFAEERHRVEAQLDETGEGSTENLRVALRRYRSFFERLLSL